MDRITFSALVRVWEYYFQIYIIIIFVFIYRNIINIKFLNVRACYCNPIKIWEDIKGSYVFEKKRGAQSDQCNLNKKNVCCTICNICSFENSTRTGNDVYRDMSEDWYRIAPISFTSRSRRISEELRKFYFEGRPIDPARKDCLARVNKWIN